MRGDNCADYAKKFRQSKEQILNYLYLQMSTDGDFEVLLDIALNKLQSLKIVTIIMAAFLARSRESCELVIIRNRRTNL